MEYRTLEGNVKAIQDVSFNITLNSSFGLVGESGCGKTSVAMSLLQLQADNAEIISGNIIYDHSDNALTIATNGGTNERLRVNATGLSVTGSISASNGFSGNLTGNVNGQLTGTLQTAAQTNITSVGILNRLTVDGNVLLDNTSRYLSLKGALLDKDGETGANGEVLVSTGSQVDWQNPNTLTASNSIKVTITENDNNNDFPITFSIAAGQSGGNTLHSDNQFTYLSLIHI